MHDLTIRMLRVTIAEAMVAAYDQGYVAGGGDTSIENDPEAIRAYITHRNETLTGINHVIVQSANESLTELSEVEAAASEG